MATIETAQRRNRILLTINAALLAGAIGLAVWSKGRYEWLVLLGCVANLMTTLATRRTLARQHAAEMRR